MESRNICMVLSYDGTDFVGWQRQRNGRSVQATLEDALGELHGYPVTVRVAGRTDSGVHARGQVVNFRSDSTVPENRFPEATNRLLPPDVRIVESRRAVEDFDARFDAKVRVYRYRISCDRIVDAGRRRFVWAVHRRVDLARLSSYAACLVGSHDFASFAAAGDTSGTSVRAIYSASFYPQGGELVFKIAGNAFLYRMVRSLVGTMVDLDFQHAPVSAMHRILEARDRESAGPTAPAWGLSLDRVVYNEQDFF